MRVHRCSYYNSKIVGCGNYVSSWLQNLATWMFCVQPRLGPFGNQMEVATGEGGRAQKKLDPIVDPLQRRSVETRQRWQRVALRFEREVSVATLSVSFSVGVI